MEKSKLKILIVDDETEVAKMFGDLVEQWGYTPLLAFSADEALRILETEYQKVIMVFSDFKMPEKNGFDFRKETIEKYRSIPFCIVSGYVTKEMALSGIDLKICGFLSKPINEKKILTLLEKESSERVQEIEFEEELRDIYLEESTELIQEVEPLLLSLEEDPGNMDVVNAIYRLIHTIKGGCNVLENAAVADFLHHYEDLYSAIKSQKIEANSAVISVLLKGFDKVNNIFTTIVSGGEVTDSRQSLLSLLEIKDLGAEAAIIETTSDDKQPEKTNTKSKKKEVLSVPMAMLDEFMAQSGEITVIRNMVNKLVATIGKELPASKSVQHLEELLEEMHKINAIMQTKLTEIRKVPLSTVFRPVPRTVRDLCKNIGKSVKLEVHGDQLRVDTVISQVLNNSIIHMVRNSVDHGIESPEIRQQKNKDPEGLLKIVCYESGESIIVEISDDGAGINAQRIRKKVIEKGLADEQMLAQLSDEQVFHYLFEPGFSTAEKITDVSGRGVGMDMVRTSIEGLGGRIDIQSEMDKGTQFKLTMPIPKSVQIINALIVMVDRFELSIPQDNVSRLLILDQDKVKEAIWEAQGSELLSVDGSLMCILKARQVLGLPDKAHNGDGDRHFVLVRTDDKCGYALEVDCILDNESIVVKDLETCIADRGLFAGATFLGDGQVGLILDVEGLASHAGLETAKLASGQHTELSLHNASATMQDYISVRLRCEGHFAIRLDQIFRFERMSTESLQYSGEQPVVKYRDAIMPIYELTRLLGFNVNPKIEVTDEYLSLIVVRSESHLFGMQIQSLEDVYHLDADLKPLIQKRLGLTGNLIIEGKNHVVIDLDEVVDLVEGKKKALKVRA